MICHAPEAAPFPVFRVAPTFVLKYNIRAVRALGSARSDLAGLDEVVEGGAGDVQYLGDRGLGDILAQQHPDVLDLVAWIIPKDVLSLVF